MSVACDHVWTNARLLTMAGGADGLGRIDHGVVAALDGRILYAGPASGAAEYDAPYITDCEGRWITPGLIDCHTHLVYAGDRAHEFEQRLAGATYEDIAKAGGGILSTVTATRNANAETLLTVALQRLDAFIAEGVTTIEVKSGYGLTLADEVKLLRVARELAEHRRISVRTTFLGAHTVPPEVHGDADAYVEQLCRDMLPAVQAEGLADAVDAFCETIAFAPNQVAKVFLAARALGLDVKLHADQLSNLGGAELAAGSRALSADHLEYADERGLKAMADAGTVAVMLPGAYYFTRETQAPPIAAMRRLGVTMALATDSNPGTSPLTSILLVLNMAATLFRLTVPECLLGVTRHAARALGCQDDRGTLEPGKRCDLAIWDIQDPAELVYRIGANPLHARIWGGEP